ncbi:uncharacterized protein LOC116204515 [Punica granatum]|uniref:Uncharacterized protein LOC116204515 n=4 Tax=Punica granatum TaxID=22663 RepID=A0A6P8DLF8_PUNGR|nr:uncharacterized protein LOC116204515 [Punica granatum]
MKAMETIQDLIEEGKLRTVWWALCIFAVTYFLSHTSKSMLMNIPVAILLVSGLRILLTEVEFRRKVRSGRPHTYLTLLERKQMSLNDSRLSTPPPPPKWKRKIGSPVVEAAANEFIEKLLKEFVVDLWYSDITPDKDFPEQIRGIILDAIGEISGRVKAINLVDLLTRDIIDLVGDHLDVFRRIQATIGTDVMRTLSSEERDERLKYHLMASKELHPALISPESEYKVLQHLMSGVIASVLKPREAQCPVVRSIARELVTCLVVQPLMNFASPVYVNEILELIFLALKEDGANIFSFGADQSTTSMPARHDSSTRCTRDVDASSSRNQSSSVNRETDIVLYKTGHSTADGSTSAIQEEQKAGNWAKVLEAATQRRTEVLTPENLENMWSRGRNYKKKEAKKVKGGEVEEPILAKSSGSIPTSDLREFRVSLGGKTIGPEEKAIVHLNPTSGLETPLTKGTDVKMYNSIKDSKESWFEENHEDELEDTVSADENITRLKRSSSTSALKVVPDSKKAFTVESRGPIISEFYNPSVVSRSGEYKVKSVSDVVYRSEGPHTPKLRCRVMGAYFEKLGSKSFAVYSIAVTDTECRTWFVKRRYSNFERLHRQLKEIPNYTLQLPPKRIFSSSTEDAFVHQRCIQLDKYLQDLLSIANVAEQHEVWDFLSASSKNYSFGKSSSVMRTLAVNVDDAVDDIVRQFKGVSNGLMRKVVGATPPPSEYSNLITERNLSWHGDEFETHISRQSTAETSSMSDNEEGDRDRNHGHEVNEWHSEDEVKFKSDPPRVVQHDEETGHLGSDRKDIVVKSDQMVKDAPMVVNFQVGPDQWGDPNGMPPEWTPPNVCVPMLNLVDKVFQLKRRGWLRRQVFWISKQILQLVMEDAIDDFLLRQIQWLRSEDTIAKGIHWVQDILWPNGKFFISLRSAVAPMDDDAQPGEKLLDTISKFGGSKGSKANSFELQLEATRRASDVKKMLFDGAPTALVSLVGPKQYRRCARDIYYFSQSTICVKQLTYGVLELLLISVFPELRDLVVDVRQKMAPRSPEKNSQAF